MGGLSRLASHPAPTNLRRVPRATPGVNTEVKVHRTAEQKYISLKVDGPGELVSGRGSARETVCEVNRQRAMIGGGLEQTKEFGVEA